MKAFYPSFFGLCCCVLLGAHPAAGQIIWDRTTGTTAFSESSVAVLSVPGGYVNVGQSGRDGTGRQPYQVYLAKVDDAGQVVWQRGQPFFNLTALYPQAAAADAAGQFYVAAAGFPNEPAGAPSVGLLVKYTAVGDTLWTRTFRAATTSGLNKVVATADGGAVVIGQQGTDNFVAKYSAAGALVWRHTYDYSAAHPGYLAQVAPLPSGFLVVDDPNYGGLPSKYLVLDPNGALVATKPAPIGYPFALQPDRAGNLLAATGGLAKISPAGDSLGSRHYQLRGGDFNVLFAAEVPGGGRYLLAGTRFNGVDHDLGLLLVDAAGAAVRDTLFVVPGTDEYPTGLGFDAAGNYVVGGYYADPTSYSAGDQTLFKLRAFRQTLAAAPAAGAPAYHLFPNPVAADHLDVTCADGTVFVGAYEVLDATGQAVCTGRATPQGLFLGGLPAGLYLVRLRDGPRWLPAGRLVRL